MSTITLHKYDLPVDHGLFNTPLAVDTETLGLNVARDALCLVQLSSGDGHAHLVQIDRDTFDAPNLKMLLEDNNQQKLFHYARFDVAVLKRYLKTDITNIYCSKIASKLCRTYTDRHGLKDLCSELLDITLDKTKQTSHWGAEKLDKKQQAYAASDVLYLHEIKEKLDDRLKDLGRLELAQKCFDFLPTRASLDLAGWPETDIFAHS